MIRRTLLALGIVAALATGAVAQTTGGGGASSPAVTNHAVAVGTGTAGQLNAAGPGTSGQVLTSNGASADPTYQTGPAMVLISEVVTSGSQASVTFSSIPATYRDLIVRVRGRGDTSAADTAIRIQFNADTGSNYDYATTDGTGNATFQSGYSGGQGAATDHIDVGFVTAATGPANAESVADFTVFDYRGTTFQKTVRSKGMINTGTSLNQFYIGDDAGNWRSTSAINAVKVFLAAGAFVDNSVVSLYGSY